MKLKNPTSNHERRLLAILSEQIKDLSFGKITLDITVQGNKIKMVELSKVKKSEKFD